MIAEIGKTRALVRIELHGYRCGCEWSLGGRRGSSTSKYELQLELLINHIIRVLNKWKVMAMWLVRRCKLAIMCPTRCVLHPHPAARSRQHQTAR